ncbi:MAG: M23 family metallopeptidase, partial [Prevotellaceae bacterium]|nr:M23 family metallopeptidase [Prevotellaceae bacterium]
TTYAEVWHMRLSRLNIVTFFGSVALVGVGVMVALIALTPLRELIPGYPDSKTRRNIVQNAQRLDSLEKKVQRWVLYNDNMSRILSGLEPIDIETATDTALAQRYRDIMLDYSAEDSLFCQQVEEMELQNLTMLNSGENLSNAGNLHFFPPVRGRVVGSFNPQERQFGVCVEVGAGSVVMATLSGTIVAASWTIENGYMVSIQHEMNITTVYKNSKQLFKQIGSKVNAGEAIAVINDEGALIFEIWRNGTPVNPEQHIVF